MAARWRSQYRLWQLAPGSGSQVEKKSYGSSVGIAAMGSINSD